MIPNAQRICSLSTRRGPKPRTGPLPTRCTRPARLCVCPAFAVLARALDMPWPAVFNGDDAGKGCCEAIAQRGFAGDEIGHRGRTRPNGDPEGRLVADGLGRELGEIMATRIGGETALPDSKALLHGLRHNRQTALPLSHPAFTKIRISSNTRRRHLEMPSGNCGD